MSEFYNDSITSLKTVKHETAILDAQKILVYPKTGHRTARADIIDLIEDAKGDTQLLLNDINKFDSRLVSNEIDTYLIQQDVKSLQSNAQNLASLLTDKANVAPSNRFTEYYTEDTTFTVAQDDTRQGIATNYVHLGYHHVPKGIIKSVGFQFQGGVDAGNNIGSTAVYLIAEIFNADGSSASRYRSTAALTISQTYGEYNTWQFEGITAPNEGQKIRFTITTNENGTDWCGNGLYLPVYVDRSCNYSDCTLGDQGYMGMVIAKFTGDFIKEPVSNEYSLSFTNTDKQIVSALAKEKGLRSQFVRVFSSLLNGETTEGRWVAVKGFTIGRPRLQSGIVTRLYMPYSGGAASTSNATLVVDLRDKHNSLIQRVISKTAWSYNPGATSGIAYWDFDELLISDEVEYLIVRPSTDGGVTINPATQLVGMRITQSVDDDSGSEYPDGRTGENLAGRYALHVYGEYEKFDTPTVVSDKISLSGILTTDITTEITDMNQWLREQVHPLRKTNGKKFSTLSLGSSSGITKVNFNDLRELDSDYLAETCDLQGDVILYLPVLEVGNGTLFNTLNLNDHTLTIEYSKIERLTAFTNTLNGSPNSINLTPNTTTTSIPKVATS